MDSTWLTLMVAPLGLCTIFLAVVEYHQLTITHAFDPLLSRTTDPKAWLMTIEPLTPLMRSVPCGATVMVKSAEQAPVSSTTVSVVPVGKVDAAGRFTVRAAVSAV